ncbi:MAG: ABC transporter ATP-binding protein [Clostridia bacterium]|nr:ABC transporter ATP-binding protein [Clostridia bacterium]
MAKTKNNPDVPVAEYESRYASYRKERNDEQKPENAKKTVLRFFALIKPHWFPMLLVVISALGATASNLISPRFMQDLINLLQQLIEAYVDGGKPGTFAPFQDPTLRNSLIGLAVCYGLNGFFAFTQEFFSVGVSQKLVYGLRGQLNAKLSMLPLSYYDKQTKGQVISKMINDIDNVSSSLQASILTVVTSGLQVVISLVMMLSTGNYILTLAAIALVPVSGSISYLVSKKSKIWYRRYWNTMGDLNGHIEEMYAGHTIVRIFGHEKQSIAEFREITERLGHNSFVANMIAGILNPVLTLIKNLNYIAICLLGGYFYLGEAKLPGTFHGIGDISAFLSYSGYFSSPIINLSRIINSLQSSLASAERVFAVLDEEEITPDDLTNDGKEAVGGIEFKDVSFRYLEDVPLIEHLDLSAAPGSLTAIVGPTGAGKTTIVNLLMRFYDINGGHIYLDGTDIYTMSRNALRANFGMVLQDTWLFKGTVRENIRYGRADATDEEVEAAAKAAFIYDYIMTLPEGFETEINEDGTNMSQGQKQLLTIARALVANPKILILDEATSSVDTKTEQKIQSAMKELMKGRTSFVIAHRLSTIKNADNILVMKKGTIVEQGTHEQLLAADGFYALLYNSQYTDGIPPED